MKPKKRAPHSVGLCALFLFALLLGLPAPPASAQSAAEKLAALGKLPAAERKAKLEEGANREGKVFWYGTYSLEEAEPFIKVFKARYPKIDVQYFRGSTEPLLDKILGEASAGRLAADIVSIDAEAFEEIKKAGAVDRYCSPERGAVLAPYKDKDCLWTAMYHNPKVIAYNTKKVPEAEAPKSWEELADPKWRGQIGIPGAEGGQWVAAILSVYGKQKGMDYLKRMAQQKIQLHKSNSGLAQLVAAGDVAVGFMVNVPAVGNVQKKGGPIEGISPDPLFTKLVTLSLTKTARNAYAAGVLMDFILSKEGQQAIDKFSIRFSVRNDVKNRFPKVVEGRRPFVIGPELSTGAAFQDADKIFEELFVRR